MIDISPRVQRLIVRSFPYLPFKVVYKKGTDIPVADALSHVTPMDTEDNIQLPIIAVNMITTQILMSVESQGSFSNKLDQLRKSAVQDEQLTTLKGYISTGFPCNKKNLLTDLHEFWPHKEMLSIKSGLITCGNRIIVPKEMRPEMLQYIHKGHQGKERCLLRARNTILAQDDLQRPATHSEVYHKPGVWKVTTKHRHYPRTTSFLMAHIGNRHVLLEKNGLSDSGRCILKIHHSEEIAKFHLSSCVHRAIYDCNRIMPTHIMKSDNGPCYNSKEFQQFLQHYNITHQTSSPNHPRSNGFVERMVGVAEKLMDKAGKEGKLWVSGLFDYRVTPQSGSIISPLQLLTQCTPREKNLLPSTLGAPEMHQTH